MKNIILIIFVFVIACSRDDSVEFTKVAISYSHAATIKEGEWIEVDGNRIVHVGSLKEMNLMTIPVSDVVVDSIENKVCRHEINYIGMGIYLARAVESLSGDNVKYIVKKDFDLHMQGKVKITRSDDHPISIRYSDNYPVFVTEDE